MLSISYRFGPIVSVDIDQFTKISSIGRFRKDCLICKEVFNLINTKELNLGPFLHPMSNYVFNQRIINMRNLKAIDIQSAKISNLYILRSLHNLKCINISSCTFNDSDIIGLKAAHIIVNENRFATLKEFNSSCRRDYLNYCN